MRRRKVAMIAATVLMLLVAMGIAGWLVMKIADEIKNQQQDNIPKPPEYKVKGEIWEVFYTSDQEMKAPCPEEKQPMEFDFWWEQGKLQGQVVPKAMHRGVLRNTRVWGNLDEMAIMATTYGHGSPGSKFNVDCWLLLVNGKGLGVALWKDQPKLFSIKKKDK